MQQDLAALNNQAIVTAAEYTDEFAWPTVVLTALVVAGVSASLWMYAAGRLPGPRCRSMPH